MTTPHRRTHAPASGQNGPAGHPGPPESAGPVGLSSSRQAHRSLSSGIRTERSRPRRPPLTTGVVGLLNHEWEQRRLTVTPTGWPTVWAAYPTVGDVLDRIGSADCAQAADDDLHALLTLHASGDALAGRLVLQSMLGKVVELAKTARARGFADPHSVVLELMWTAVHSYPLRRTSSVAANLALDALHQMDQQPAIREIPVSTLGNPTQNPETVLEWLVAVQESADAAAASELEARLRRLVHTLHWAVSHQVLSGPEVRLLARVHLGVGATRADESMRTIADEMGITHAALRKRHSRAVQTLSTAVLQRIHR